MRDRYKRVYHVRGTEPKIVWKRTGEHIITPKGRWGYQWLHRLVWRMATNLGMIRHAKIEAWEHASYTVIDAYDEKIGKVIFELMQDFLYDGVKPSDMTIIMGRDHFSELCLELHRTFSYQHTIQIGYANQPTRLYDVQVIVNPYMEGAIVLPKNLIQYVKEEKKL